MGRTDKIDEEALVFKEVVSGANFILPFYLRYYLAIIRACLIVLTPIHGQYLMLTCWTGWFKRLHYHREEGFCIAAR